MKNNKVSITPPTFIVNRVAAIKAIRSLTGLGLKEAKDASERAGVTQVFNLAPGLTPNDIDLYVQTLRAEGVEVGNSVHIILRDLRELAASALELDEDELANEILQLVLAEKLRRKV